MCFFPPCFFSFSSTHVRTRRGEHRTELRNCKKAPTLFETTIDTNALSTSLRLRCALRVAPHPPSNNPRSVQENGISDGARRRPVAQWNACVLWVHALPRIVLSTAGRQSASGMGETVRLHFGARRFTGDGRMKVNSVFLSPLFFFFFKHTCPHTPRRAPHRTQKLQEGTYAL